MNDFFYIWCQDNYINPGRQGSAKWRRAMRLYEGLPEPDLSQLNFSDSHDLTFDDIVAMTGDVPGTTMAICPQCYPAHYRQSEDEEEEELNEDSRTTETPKHCLKIVRRGYNTATYYCIYCGKEGRAVRDKQDDWEGEADWKKKHAELKRVEKAERTAAALKIWNDATSLIGSPAQAYLKQRGITELPPNVDEVLRFHPHCPFGINPLGRRTEGAVMLALYRDPKSGKPIGVHRTLLPGIWRKGVDVKRLDLGPQGVIQLWPLGESERLVVGEGIETVLSAAQAFTDPTTGEPLKPAWAFGTANNLEINCLVQPKVERLVVLADNDRNEVGQRAAATVRETWELRGCNEVTTLMPPEAGTDFNNLLLDQLKAARDDKKEE
jgi:hypothetical protein